MEVSSYEDIFSEMSDDCILYELLIYSEWKQEPELTKYPKSNDEWNLSLPTPLSSAKHIWQHFSRRDLLSEELFRLLHHQLPWHFAVGESGKVVAILQDTLLEIRTLRDEYSSVVGKAAIARDLFPQWRRLVWSPDCSMLAVSHSNGIVAFYDLLGSNIFNIYPPKFEQEVPCSSTTRALACVLFLQSRIKSPKWSGELLLVDYEGLLRSYLVSPTDGFQENHTFSFASHYHQGVVSVKHHSTHNLLFVAGPSIGFAVPKFQDHGSQVGLLAWRLLNDYPYYRLALSNEEQDAMLQAQRSLWNWLPSIRRKPNQVRSAWCSKDVTISDADSILQCQAACVSELRVQDAGFSRGSSPRLSALLRQHFHLASPVHQVRSTF